MGALLDDLRNRTGHTAIAWAPKPGDGIEGLVASVGHRPGDENARRTEYQVVVIDTPEGRIAWHAAGLIAKDLLDLHRPIAGDTIAVIYIGEITSKRGATYKQWALAVDHQNPSPRDPEGWPTQGPRATRPPANRPGMENGPDDYPDTPDHRRTEIDGLLNTAAPAIRLRCKLTYAARFDSPATTPANQLDQALAWTKKAVAGTEILDPLYR